MAQNYHQLVSLVASLVNSFLYPVILNHAYTKIKIVVTILTNIVLASSHTFKC